VESIKKEKIDNAVKEINKYLPLRRRLGTAVYCYQRLQTFPRGQGFPQPLDSNQEYIAIYDAMIISYMSCFVSNSSGNFILRPQKVFKGKPELKTFHDDLYKARNKIIAHNEIDCDNCYPLIGNDGILLKFITNIPIPSIDGFKLFDEILRVSWEYMYRKILNISNKLEGEIGIRVNIDSKN